MIALHYRADDTFFNRWLAYCNENKVDYKVVNCYGNDILSQLKGCDGLMWHYYQGNPKDIIMAKSLLFSLQHSGLKVFPDFRTAWHFDDKLAQKYLLEALEAPIAKTWVFYDKTEALKWAESANFPKVFKLRGGSGSQNVFIIRTKRGARKIIIKAFKSGFKQYDAYRSLKERWRRFVLKKTNMKNVLVGIIRLIIPPPYSIIKGRERGYVYFQDYIAGNDCDIRVIVIGDKAFAIKRLVRKNDFRASGSGLVLYDKDLFNRETISLSFELAEKLDSQCVAFDYVYEQEKVIVLEISYGFVPEVYDSCQGYWTKDLKWHEGPFNPYGWMVADLIQAVKASRHE
jgi:hypothetical protein